MPYITHLSVSSFRNLTSISLEPNPKINIVSGPNGAGKSSVLESISMLAHGRSFRTHKYRNLINDQSKDFVVRGSVALEDGSSITVGLCRQRKGDFTIRLDGKNVSSASTLAKQIPLLVINSTSFRLLEGSSKDRRRFFDWLVFHVKHQFQSNWNQVVKCYKQRNSLLRHDKISYADIEPWDIEIARLSELIIAQRTECFHLLNEAFKELLSDLVGKLPDTTEFHLKSGWKDGDTSLLSQLRSCFKRDLAYGYSTLGPHKSDFTIKVSGVSAYEILSRGQQKLLISALYVAQASVLKSVNGLTPIFAVDDLPSELDSENQEIVGAWLTKLDSQVFVTGIDENCASTIWPTSKASIKMFHVKHGEIQQDL